jgi:hypothetical protein
MGYKEYNIDGRYRLYGRYYNTLESTDNINPFLAAHRTVLDSSGDVGLVARYNNWKKLDALSDVLVADAQNDKYIPLHFQLVMPDGVGTAPYPLAVFIHGQSSTYFDNDGNAMPETKSYRGYRYLQQYLANKGVASISVNVNVASYLEDPTCGHEHYEQQGRIHICFLVLAALKQISDAPVTLGQPIRFKKTDNSVVMLQDALALLPPFGTGSQEALLQRLKSEIQGKLSYTTFGFMGHSRGADTVQVLQPYFTARVGTAPADYASQGPSTITTLPIPTGAYNSNTRRPPSADFRMIAHQYHAIHDVAAIFGSPNLTHLKTVVALEPSRRLALIDSPTTFFFVLASSHDEDVQEGAFNSYENVNAPKAMIFSHGASHGRFNSVWRQLPSKRASLNRSIACQSPIHMLSNAGHENLANATIGNALLAGLRGQNHRYRFFDDRIRATSIGQDLERAWKFPFPFASPPTMVLLDTRALTATNTSTNAAVPIEVEANLNGRSVAGNHVFANEVAAKRVTRPRSERLALRIPVVATDNLATRTHFSFRYTKEYDPRVAAQRRAIDLKNYILRIKSGATVIGNPINGADVRTQVHPAYFTRQYNYEAPGDGCYDDTMIIMQTAEVPLSQFLRSGQPVTDLNQVNTLEITLNGRSGATGDEVFFFLDLLLTTRTLPDAPSGFAIP